MITVLKSSYKECEMSLHQVKAGETYESIAKDYKTDLNALKQLNFEYKTLCTGDCIFIREINVKTYVVQPLDTVESISRKLNIKTDDLIKRNNINNKNIFIGQILYLP